MTETMETTNMMTSKLLTVGQVAELLSVCSRTIYRLADAGRFPRPLKIGSAVRWRLTDVEAWITREDPR